MQSFNSSLNSFASFFIALFVIIFSLATYYHNFIIDDISVRIHVGSITKKQICSIIEFANNNHLQIEYNEQYIPISWENIICMIKESRALEFIKDPEKFFDKISTE